MIGGKGNLYAFNGSREEGISANFDDFQSSVIAARMRKMTLQEDTVPESIIQLPKTPYIR